jgi:hypothetical protein
MVVYGAFALFWAHPDVSILELGSPWLAAFLVLMLIGLPLLGNLFPERISFLLAMQRITRAYDRLFGVPMPYMMAMHQARAEVSAQAHLHVEFYPILRDKGKLKYLAGSESGAGVFINDTLAEDSAERLRALLG